jgi:hypothetical protein
MQEDPTVGHLWFVYIPFTQHHSMRRQMGKGTGGVFFQLGDTQLQGGPKACLNQLWFDLELARIRLTQASQCQVQGVSQLMQSPYQRPIGCQGMGPCGQRLVHQEDQGILRHLR